MRIRHLICAAALAVPRLAAAQSDHQAPLALLLPAGPRTLALGNTGVASRDDDVIFFDPAMLAIANGFSVSGERIDREAATGAVSAVTRFNRTGGVGIGMRFAHSPLPALGYPATRATMLGAGAGMLTSLEAIAGVAQVYRGVRVGVSGKYAEDVGPAMRVSRALADVGVSRDFFRTTFALAVQNIGQSIAGEANAGARDISLPLRATVGASRQGPVGPFDLFGTAAVSTLGRDVIPSGGLEVSYSWLSGYAVALRGGVRRASVGEDPATAGAAFTMDRLSIDYALEALDGGRLGHRLGVRIR
jgi:hypothetical protein